MSGNNSRLVQGSGRHKHNRHNKHNKVVSNNSHLVQGSKKLQRVHIELQRVQTWLFSVPRLRAMVGANTLIGETLRINLPNLARNGDNKWALAPLIGDYPPADQSDPLKDEDNPQTDAVAGILARDGGHFEAQFAHGAEAFADAAAELLRRELPGLRFRISINREERQKAQIYLSTELPVLAPCQWTGRGLAAKVIWQGNEYATVSLDVARRHEAAKRAEEYRSRDLASMLGKTLGLDKLQSAQDLHDLVGSGYLALIHADGNSVGSNAGTTEEQRARFFHQNRVLIRRALQQAIGTVHKDETGINPLVMLMLGGDDLLVVCRAEKALPFVVSLCDELKRLQDAHADGFQLTLGVGVVIAKPTIPMHRLHEVAEQLASSAKRRFRGLRASEQEARSVVDWAVYTTAWVDEPEAVRRRDWIRGTAQNQRLLSQRPLDVLGEGLDSLQGLVCGTKMLKGAPRSQLRYLVEQLPRGRTLAELAFEELSKEASDKLRDAGVSLVWQDLPDGSASITPLLDLVEVVEIDQLGRRNNKQPTESPGGR